MTEKAPAPVKRKGRPPKVKRPVGRPKGEAAIMKEYRSRMLNSPKSRKVLDAVFNAALDDGHKHQAAAWKLLMDRIVPVEGFKSDNKNNKPKIEVNITSFGDTSVESVESSARSEPIEAEYHEVSD